MMQELVQDVSERMLIVDDDDTFRERLARAMRSRGFEVVQANGIEQVVALGPEPFERAVVDLRMPGASGIDVIRHLRALHPGLRAVVLTGYASIPTAVEAVRAGAFNYLAKPAHADAILAAFEEPAAQDTEGAPETPSLASVEWEHIHRVLTDCEGNISEAARRLGLHRRSLQRKLYKYPPPR
jgi:two-component system response regulator RegA